MYLSERQRRWKELLGIKKEKLRKDFHPTCSRCGEPLKSWKLIEAHHIIPVSQGGPDTDENVTLVHSKCHLEIHVEMAEAARSSM